MELQHIMGQPQTYTVSPIWNCSEAAGSFSSCPEKLHPIRSIVAMIAIICFISKLPDGSFDTIIRNRIGLVDGSKIVSNFK